MDIQLALKLAECPAQTYSLSSNSLMLKTLYLLISCTLIVVLCDFSYGLANTYKQNTPCLDRPSFTEPKLCQSCFCFFNESLVRNIRW